MVNSNPDVAEFVYQNGPLSHVKKKTNVGNAGFYLRYWWPEHLFSLPSSQLIYSQMGHSKYFDKVVLLKIKLGLVNTIKNCIWILYSPKDSKQCHLDVNHVYQFIN